MSFLSQIKRAEESEFILRCDVRFEQQCSTQTLQDLGGEKPLNATVSLGQYEVSPFTK